MTFSWRIFFTTLLMNLCLAEAAGAAPVMLISIDGMSADDLSHADEHGLKIPTLRALAAGGAVATAVRGVLPTITFPSHTTLITGVYPSKHGIVENVQFDPEGGNLGGWMWYAEDIKVPTLWDMVKANGGKVANIGWPVSVGARSIDYNIPEFWRAKNKEDEKLLRAVTTPRMIDEVAQATGIPFAQVAVFLNETHEGMDDARTAWAGEISVKYKPQLFTLHLGSLDGTRHKYGPYSPEAMAALEHIDQLIGTLISRVRRTEPDLVIAVVSDHGFLQGGKTLNLGAALAAEGMIAFDGKGKISKWSVYPWADGGSAAIILKNPSDKVMESRVGELLIRLSANPANGVAEILDRSEIATLGGAPQASFWVNMKGGFNVRVSSTPDLVQAGSGKGVHGYSPLNDGMLSAFVINGPGIARRQLGLIDIRDIGPTIGEVLGSPLPHPDGKILPVLEAVSEAAIRPVSVSPHIQPSRLDGQP